METDAQLLRESRRRPDAYVEVCRRHVETLSRWLRRQVGPNEADDLLAETFARGWNSRRRFRDPGHGSAGPWLQGIAANLVRDYHRTGAIEARARLKLGLPAHAQEPGAFAEADERLTAISDFEKMRSRLHELPDEQRAALALRVLNELDYHEIGERLSVSPVTARTRVHRALEALRMNMNGRDS
jgi:RNA polymerase sigma factor (sigma-70 family)